MNNFISSNAEIGRNVLVGQGVRIWANSVIHDNCIIEDNVQIGHPSPSEVSSFRKQHHIQELNTLDIMDSFVKADTVIGHQSIIRSGTVIYSGVTSGVNFDCGHNVCIRERCQFGDNCYLTGNTELRRDVSVGNNTKLAGTICDRSIIGNNVTMLGHLMHTYRSCEPGHIEEAPILEDDVIVGREAYVIGKVQLGKGSFVSAGSAVTTSIPPYTLVGRQKNTFYTNKSPVKKVIR